MNTQISGIMDTIPHDLRLFTAAEAAAILNVSLRTLQSWVREGQLPHTRLGEGGRLVRIRAKDLQQFIDDNYQTKRLGS